MESLPAEMVVEVGQYLTPRDLASCVAVSRKYHDIFNNNSLWQQHCDPSLVEPLEKTPCVVEPRFVSPEMETSTLSPISHWRMAFLREQHLWKNYKLGKGKRCSLRGKKGSEGQLVKGWDFLSNTLLVRCFINRIDIWEVSTFPASIIASINLDFIYYFKAYRTNRLLILLEDLVKVFHVDPSENVIELVHNISVEQSIFRPDVEEKLKCVNGSFYIHVNTDGRTLDVIDLEKGMQIKKESCPGTWKENENATIVEVRTSTNSNYVIVIVQVNSCFSKYIYIYSPGQLVFSSRCISKNGLGMYAINGDYLAFSAEKSLHIYNCITFELVSKKPFHFHGHPFAFNDGFLCDIGELGHHFIGMFSLSSKTWTTVTLYHPPGYGNCLHIEIINNKFISYFAYSDSTHEYEEHVWEASGRTLKRSEIPYFFGDKINDSFTRVVLGHRKESCVCYYYW